LREQDEIFHVPQAQAYCRGEWKHWDGALTTPPGLCVFLFLPFFLLLSLFLATDPRLALSHLRQFLSSTFPPAVLASLSKLTFDPCSLSSLRAFSLSLVLLLPFLYTSLLRLLHSSSPAYLTVSKEQSQRRVGGRKGKEWEALVIALHPLVGWWAWLYYTDVASLFTVLLCWREGLKGRQYRAAAVRPFPPSPSSLKANDG
jgi:alpha-1,2-glucosyltransferase